MGKVHSYLWLSKNMEKWENHALPTVKETCPFPFSAGASCNCRATSCAMLLASGCIAQNIPNCNSWKETSRNWPGLFNTAIFCHFGEHPSGGRCGSQSFKMIGFSCCTNHQPKLCTSSPKTKGNRQLIKFVQAHHCIPHFGTSQLPSASLFSRCWHAAHNKIRFWFVSCHYLVFKTNIDPHCVIPVHHRFSICIERICTRSTVYLLC